MKFLGKYNDQQLFCEQCILTEGVLVIQQYNEAEICGIVWVTTNCLFISVTFGSNKYHQRFE